MSETVTYRIDVTVYHPNGDVMERYTVPPYGVAAKVEQFEALGYRVEAETVAVVETRQSYEECSLTYAHTQLICGNPFCRTS